MGLRFRVWGLGFGDFRVWGLGLGVRLGIWGVGGCGFRRGLGGRVWGYFGVRGFSLLWG